MHGLPTIHKLNDAEARRIMEHHGYDTSEWPSGTDTGRFTKEGQQVHDVNAETFDQPEGE